MATLKLVTGDENRSQNPGLLNNIDASKRPADCFLSQSMESVD
jgi:hypothetical protein